MTRPRFSYEGSGRGAIALSIAALASIGTGCGSRAGGANSAGSVDAAVTFQSALVTNPATWNSLWGSWPAARQDHSMAYDSDLKRIILFGGRGSTSGPDFGDLWEWDASKRNWLQRTPPGTPAMLPSYRSDHKMVYDTVRKKTLMFGGWQPGAAFIHPEWWDWDSNAQTWTKHSLSTTQPTPRFGHTFVWDSTRGKAILFGGIDDTTGRLQDIWEWDGTNWLDRTPSGTKPTARHSAQMVYDAGRAKVVLYSGNIGSGIGAAAATGGTWVDETWEFDTAAGTWTKITAPSPTSTMWSGGTTWLLYDPPTSKIVLRYYWNQLWEYNPTTPAWTAVPSTTPTKVDTAEPPYYSTHAVYDSGNMRQVFMGGQYGQRRQLWELNIGDYTWVNRSQPTSGPIQRQYPSIAFNSKSNTMVVFGGYVPADTQNPYKQDIYEWSGQGATLTNRTNGLTKPPARNQAGMVYDSKRDRVLLFGGTSGTAYDDLWSWNPDPNSGEWTQITFTGARPTARSGIWMFYDAVRDKVYVYGSGWGNYQIWEYDPALNKWLDRTVTSPPTGVSRSYFDVAFDSVRGKIVELGGYYGGVYTTDIWEWDTTTGTWAQATPAATSPMPDGRYYHTTAYDPIRRILLMVGGHVQVTGKNADVNDSWEWDANLSTWSETTPSGLKPLPRDQHLMVFNTMRGSTYLFGGTVPDDPTYGPSEFWEYIPNATDRENGQGCTATTADKCKSKNCVDGVCCAQAASACTGKCKSCNVAGTAGTCSNVPAGLPDDTCPSDQVCDGTQQCKKPIGQVCTLNAECGSGFCADGVCCDTACNDRCKVCNLAAKRGTCAFVASGDEDAPTCVSDPEQGRNCDGAGNCANAPKANGKACTAGAQCSSKYCVDGVCCNSACAGTCYQCDKPNAVGTCSTIAIGLVDHSATTPCDAAMQYCSGVGTCLMNKKPNGDSCTAAGDCGSGFCVDMKCCSSACTTVCQSCAVAGSFGACVNVLPGSQDLNSAPMCDGQQYCDAAGTCQTGAKPNGSTCTTNSQCGSGFCADGVCCTSACTTACYACNLPGGAGTCSPVATGAIDTNAATACAAPNYCNVDHACTMGKKPNGAVCSSDLECGSTFCVDGSCCESACNGRCRSCATGACVYVADGMDPEMECKGQGVCGGKCNGQGACRWGAADTACSQAGCQSDGFIRDAGKCDGAGNCVAPQTTDCKGFACYTDPADMKAKCRTDCSQDPECALKNYCVPAGTGDAGATSTCPDRFPLGVACQRNTQCLSNTCSDGVCCDKNCDKCGSCNTPGMLGTCIPIPKNTDPEMECMNNASDPTGACGGLCNGQARCSYPPSGTKCGKCLSCDGSGLCNQMPEDDDVCGTIECNGLNTMCMSYQDLTSKRCASPGACKMDNTTAACTVFTNTCTPDGGTGVGGSAGGSSGRGGTGGGTAGTTGNDGGGGSGGGGSGGCCAIGASETPNGWVGLLVLASVMIVRRRRR